MAAGAQDACEGRDSDVDASGAVSGHAEGLLSPVFTASEPIGYSIRARELRKVDDAAARSVGHVPCNRPVAAMESQPERPPELEGGYPEHGRRMANSIRAQST